MAIHDTDITPASISDAVSTTTTKGNYFGIFNKQEVENEKVAEKDIFTIKHSDLIKMTYKNVVADQKVDCATINDHSDKSFTSSKTITYFNLSQKHIVYVQDSSNVVMPVMPVTNMYEYSPTGNTPYDQLVIVEKYQFGCVKAAERALELICRSLNDRPGLSTSPELLQMRDNLREAIMANGRDTTYNKKPYIHLYVTRRVTLTELANTPRLYIPNLNIILSLDSDIYKLPHPASVEGSREKARKGNIKDKAMPEFNDSFEVHMDLIDNDNKISSRYVNLFGKLTRIDPKRDPMRTNGLYISRTISGLDIPGTKKYYTFEELNELHMYSTEEDALTYGNPELIAEKLKHGKSINEAYHAKITSDVKIKTESEKAEVEIAKMKYDTINNGIKIAGAAVAFAAAVLAAAMKIKSAK